MSDNEEGPKSADMADRRLRRLMTTHRRSGELAVFAAAAAVALAAFSATGSSHAAGLAKHGGTRDSGRSSRINGSGASSSTTPANENTTGLLDKWAACERGHGDSSQAEPTVDHGVIYIAVRMGALPGGDPNDVNGRCSKYLAAARLAVAGGHPIDGWGNEAAYVKYANCMRANGFPTYPYPSGVEPDGHLSTNFNGTGIDPNSPAVLNGNANQMCGKQIGAPAWWINNWGPPGDVVVYPAGANPNSPLPIGPQPSPPSPITMSG